MAEDKSNPAPTPTVAEYFRDAHGDDLLARLTDGVLDLQNPACKRFHNWPDLIRDCHEAIQRHGKVPVTDRRVLAAIMDEATRLSARRGGYPKPWLKVMSDLRRGGSLLGNMEPSRSEPESAPVWQDPNPLCFPWLHSLFKNAVRETDADLSPWKEHFEHTASARLDASYRDGWRFIDGLLTHPVRPIKDAPAPLVAVRDWLWEHDAAPDKPTAPPWDTPAKT